MNLLMTLFLVFFVPCSVMAANQIQTTELIPVKVGDIIQYPTNAEPVEVEAIINDLKYICTLMPGDAFEVVETIDFDYFPGRSQITLQKKEGTPGNHEVCHGNSSIDVIGTHEVEKSKDGIPQIVNKIHSPFVPFLSYPKDIQRRKRLPTTLADGETETILFKVDDLIVYPSDANPVEVESSMDSLEFSCTEAPGDSFRVTGILNHTINGYSAIIVKKEGGTPGSQEICPIESFTDIEIEQTKCVLKRTAEGAPEGLLCNHSLKTLFDPREETEK